MILSGRVWRLGDHVDTDQILPAKYITLADRKERASGCFENIKPGFAALAKPGDIVVAGRNFGCGSSRPSVEILQDLGLGAVVACSFARIFFRGGIARGFPLIICPNLMEKDLPEGHTVTVDMEAGTVLDETTRERFTAEGYPPFLREVLSAGGLMNYTRLRLKARENVSKSQDMGG